MANKYAYRVKVIRTEFEESDETKWVPGTDEAKGYYEKTGHKLWKAKEESEVFNQKFDEVDVADLARHLNTK